MSLDKFLNASHTSTPLFKPTDALQEGQTLLLSVVRQNRKGLLLSCLQGQQQSHK